MNLSEILKANGITDDVISKIDADMKTNKIYTSAEENIDIRYGKLKGDKATADNTITDLQTQIQTFETDKANAAAALQEAQRKIASLELENSKIKVDKELERSLIEIGVQDVDYVKFKIKEKHPDGFTFDENGKIESLSSILDDMKVQLPQQFHKSTKKVEEMKLNPREDEGKTVTSEQFEKMNYHERVKLFNENEEQYRSLIEDTKE